MTVEYKEYKETGGKCTECDAQMTCWLIVERTDPGFEWATWMGPFCDGCKEKAIEKDKEASAA